MYNQMATDRIVNEPVLRPLFDVQDLVGTDKKDGHREDIQSVSITNRQMWHRVLVEAQSIPEVLRARLVAVWLAK